MLGFVGYSVEWINDFVFKAFVILVIVDGRHKRERHDGDQKHQQNNVSAEMLVAVRRIDLIDLQQETAGEPLPNAFYIETAAFFVPAQCNPKLMIFKKYNGLNRMVGQPDHCNTNAFSVSNTVGPSADASASVFVTFL